jgi:hypothetical protein
MEAGPAECQKTLADEGALMAVVAMNTTTRSRVNLTPLVRDGGLNWQARAGTWKVMVFQSVPTKPFGSGTDYHSAVDHLDPAAVQWFVDTVYEPHAWRSSIPGRSCWRTVSRSSSPIIG